VKIRNPKSEIRNKFKARRPKGSESFSGWRFLDLRSSDFFRVSDFDLRIWPSCVVLTITRLTLVVQTNGLPDQIPPLRPPRTEIPPTFWDQYNAWVLLGSALLLALFAGTVWLLTRPKREVVMPPAMRARQDLERLSRRAEDRAVLSEVSQILGRYIRAAFNLAPGEMTTTEFCHAMADNRQLGSELSAEIASFLRGCDERKFSPPASMPALGAVARASKLIEAAEARCEQLRQAATGSSPIQETARGSSA
jgi:hypothetical protein